MERGCPYCEAEDFGAGEDEGVRICRACGRSSLIDQTRPSLPLGDRMSSMGTPSPARAARRATRRAPGEVPSWPAALVAVVTTILFYTVLYLAPNARLSDLFMERGWVPYVITLVSFWALFLLGARLIRLRSEASVLERDLIPTGADGRLNPSEAALALSELRQRAAGAESSFLVGRLERALRHFDSRRRVVEVVEFLSGESSADEGRVDASYALVRVFVWVVPTLGFIGTVIGIGAAVGGFSETLEAASSVEGMKESIGSVTGGLGVAFDTTLLALVMSILIMFPASAVQRIEENFLGLVEDYCAEHLVGKLRDDAKSEVDEAVIEALARKLARAMQTAPSDGA